MSGNSVRMSEVQSVYPKKREVAVGRVMQTPTDVAKTPEVQPRGCVQSWYTNVCGRSLVESMYSGKQRVSDEEDKEEVQGPVV